MSRIPTFVALVLVLSSLVPAHGQLSSLYGFGQSLGTYTPISGGTVLADTTFDDLVIEQPVPPFFFNGSYHSTVFVSSNGYLTLGIAPVATNYTPLSNAATYTGAISP
ncbi:MAG: hypothetical protein JNM91_00705, partial [Flavobacteriales bacterium]|nr:hypothetical protein [Flavobacteriales bacterium]